MGAGLRQRRARRCKAATASLAIVAVGILPVILFSRAIALSRPGRYTKGR